MNNTILISDGEIVRKLRKKGEVILATNFYATRGNKKIELIMTTKVGEIKVVREFGKLSKDDEKIVEQNRQLKRYVKQFHLSTLEDAVKSAIAGILKLLEEGREDYLDDRLL